MWKDFVLRFSDEYDLLLPVFGGWLIMFSVYWIYGLILLYFENTRTPPFGLERRKHQPNHPMSFRKTKYSPSFNTLLKNVTFNWIFVILPTLVATQLVSRRLGLGVYVTEELPPLTFKDTVSKLGLAAILSDVLFYCSHYLLHRPWFYKHVHKIHHEFKAPYGLCAIYAHWFEALVGNTLALMAIPFLIRVHFITFWILGVFGWINTMTDHSGLDLPVPLTLSFRHSLSKTNQHGTKGFMDFHDYHHQYFTGNYGVGLFMDRLFGTDKGWKKKCQEVNHLR